MNPQGPVNARKADLIYKNMNTLSYPTLKKCMPFALEANLKRFLEPLEAAMERFEINTRLRQAAFLANVAHESGSLQYVKEIASGKAYEGRKDLGNTQEGDGVKFKGRGLFQVTGRANYKRYGELLGLDLLNHPELLELAGNAALSAGLYWSDHHLNKIADEGDFLEICKKINGINKTTGLPNGYEDRKVHYARCLAALPADAQ